MACEIVSDTLHSSETTLRSRTIEKRSLHGSRLIHLVRYQSNVPYRSGLEASLSTHHQEMTCRLSERGVKTGDSRPLSEVVDRATFGDSIEWTVFERGTVPKLQLECIKSDRRALSLHFYNIQLLYVVYPHIR